MAVAGEQYARSHEAQVAIALLDAAGDLLYFQRMERVPPISGDVALARAQYVLIHQQRARLSQEVATLETAQTAQTAETQTTHEMQETPLYFPVVGLSQPQLLAGGRLLQIKRQVLGAIGVSGAGAELDDRIAQVGIAAYAAIVKANGSRAC